MTKMQEWMQMSNTDSSSTDQNQVVQHEQHRQFPFIIIRFVMKAEGSQPLAPVRCDVITGKDLKLG